MTARWWRSLLARPAHEPGISPAVWRRVFAIHLWFCLVALAIDGLIALLLWRHPQIHQDALVAFLAINVPILAALAALFLAGLRSRRLHREPVMAAACMLIALSIVVWLQLTGTLSSYFVLASAALVGSYRFVLGHRLGLVALVAVCALHFGAIALEQVDVLRPESLLRGPLGAAYRVEAYRVVALLSLFWSYVMVFVVCNAVTHKLSAKEQALAEVRRDAERAALDLRPGRLTGVVVAGDLALGELIGRGGMGEVYMARRVSDEQTVAVKVLHGHLIDDATMVRRFQREAELAAAVPARFRADILDVGYDEDRDLHFIVMAHLRGEDLAAHLRRRSTLPPGEALTILARIAEAVDAAHAVGVVHRDLKPQNVFLEAGEGASAVKLLDFGISKILAAASQSLVEDATLTRGNAVFGTVGYMAPEQALGLADQVGPAADRWALAAVAYRALTGRTPYAAGDLLTLLDELAAGPPPPPSTLAPGLPGGVDAVFGRALARDPAARYASAGDFVRDLQGALSGAPEWARDTLHS